MIAKVQNTPMNIQCCTPQASQAYKKTPSFGDTLILRRPPRQHVSTFVSLVDKVLGLLDDMVQKQGIPIVETQVFDRHGRLSDIVLEVPRRFAHQIRLLIDPQYNPQTSLPKPGIRNLRAA